MRNPILVILVMLFVGVAAVQRAAAQVPPHTAHPAPDALAEPAPGYTGFGFVATVTVTQDLQSHRMTLTVDRVDSGSPAAEAGLRIGDRLIAIDGEDPRAKPWAMRMLPDVRYVVRIQRGAAELEVDLIPAAAPR
jgi:C-terminal processing protease CtpA/Prc